MSLFTSENPILGPDAQAYDQLLARPMHLAPREKLVWQQDSATLPSTGQWVFRADQKYVVRRISTLWTHVGGSGAVMSARKVTADVTAPDASTGATVVEFQTATVDLTATANTMTVPALSTTYTDLQLNPGDKIAIKFAGTLTALTGAWFQIELEPVLSF